MTEKIKVIRATYTKEINEARNKAQALDKRYKPLNDEKEKVKEKQKGIIQEANTFSRMLIEEYKYLFEANVKTYNKGLKLINNEACLTIDGYGGMRLDTDYFSASSEQ